jgi:hypothetical protein
VTSCARLVTLDPQTVARRNDAAWTIYARPAPPPPASAPPSPPAPTSAALTPAAATTEAPASAPSAAANDAPANDAPAAAPPPLAAADAPVAPLPFRDRPEVREALLSPPDALGIPAALYAVDPLLLDHRREMDSQAHARHTAGAATIVGGVLFAGLAGLGIALGAKDLHNSNPDIANNATQTLFWGSFLGALSLSEIVAGIVMTAKSSDPRPLQSYYRETYGAPAN